MEAEEAAPAEGAEGEAGAQAAEQASAEASAEQAPSQEAAPESAPAEPRQPEPAAEAAAETEPQPEAKAEAEPQKAEPVLNLRHKTDPAALGDGGASAEKEEHHMYNGVKVGRNDPCPCGSGKKFKKCCGRNL